MATTNPSTLHVELAMPMKTLMGLPSGKTHVAIAIPQLHGTRHISTTPEQVSRSRVSILIKVAIVATPTGPNYKTIPRMSAAFATLTSTVSSLRRPDAINAIVHLSIGKFPYLIIRSVDFSFQVVMS